MTTGEKPYTATDLKYLLEQMNALQTLWNDIDQKVRAWGFIGQEEYADTPLDCQDQVEEALRVLEPSYTGDGETARCPMCFLILGFLSEAGVYHCPRHGNVDPWRR